MLDRVVRLTLAFVAAGLALTAADVPGSRSTTAATTTPTVSMDNSHSVAGLPRTGYYWKSEAAGNGAQLLTLFCRACYAHVNGSEEVPLVSVLRDTLGDDVPENDRVSYVWLLSAPHIGAGQKALAAIPFFYWRVGSPSSSLSESDAKPQFDVAAPRNPMMAGLMRQVVQWTALDPFTVWARATSRSYQSNARDNSRYRLEEAVSYLQHAPSGSDDVSLTDGQLKTVIARLELRKSMLGGLASDKQAERYADDASFDTERIRARNWELLRQCAEKAGLYFESINLGGADGQYAMLWYRLGSTAPESGSPDKNIWKLLNISDPRADTGFPRNGTTFYTRQLDDSGQLLPEGASGHSVQLVPLGFYSLLYPKLPLLVIDFRDRMHVRLHEMTQRSITEVTSGVIGISRFTNWYYYAGAMAYNFIAGRQGTPVSMAQRLDCYSQFRVHLALDRSLQPRLHQDLEQRSQSLGVNPLDSAAKHSVALARQRYALLLKQTEEGSPLLARLNRDRRAELASFGESMPSQFAYDGLHLLTVGLYTHRVPVDQFSYVRLDEQRRFNDALVKLDDAVHNGTAPEVTYQPSALRASLETVQQLQSNIKSPALRAHATSTVQKLADLTADQTLMASCRDTVMALNLGTNWAPGATMTARNGGTAVRDGKPIDIAGVSARSGLR